MADGTWVNMHSRIASILKHVNAGKATLTELTTLMDDAAEGGHVSRSFGDAAALKPLAELVLGAKQELIARFADSNDPMAMWNVRHAQKFLPDLQARVAKVAPQPHPRPH
jgi:hypothetical protein